MQNPYSSGLLPAIRRECNPAEDFAESGKTPALIAGSNKQ